MCHRTSRTGLLQTVVAQIMPLRVPGPDVMLQHLFLPAVFYSYFAPNSPCSDPFFSFANHFLKNKNFVLLYIRGIELLKFNFTGIPC